MTKAACIYRCQVMHRRYHPISYHFNYRVFSLLIDIDRLADAEQQSTLFSIDKPNLFSFHQKDHLPDGETSLRNWANKTLLTKNIDARGLRIRLLCMPRMLGWGFDPLSVWYCDTPDGQPVAAICEVHNTFGERHCYVLDATHSAWPLRSSTEKIFHVSPFIAVEGSYAFSLDQPGESLRIAIQQIQGEQVILGATQRGTREPLSNPALLSIFFRIPLQTLKVLGAIHWHALKVWLRGVTLHRKPEPPLEEIS